MWRPPARVRPIAIAIVRRRDEILVMRVEADDGTTKGWRPVGGAIEFGERAAETITREVREELGVELAEGPRFLAVLENLYDHEGAPGHELVMLFDVRLPDAMMARERFDFTDGGVTIEAGWVPLAAFRDGRERLFPDGLLVLLPVQPPP